MFVYREQYYLERAEPTQKPGESASKYNERLSVWADQMAVAASKAEVIIAKQRRGPVGTIRLHFDPPTVKFSNLAREGNYDL